MSLIKSNKKDDNSFLIYITGCKGKSGKGEIEVKKATFNRESYFDFLPEHHHISHHPNVVESKEYAAFLKELIKKEDVSKKYYRCVKFMIFVTKNSKSTAANKYLTPDTSKFQFNGTLLLPERPYLSDVDKSIEYNDEPLNHQNLFAMYESLDTEDEEEKTTALVPFKPSKESYKAAQFLNQVQESNQQISKQQQPTTNIQPTPAKIIRTSAISTLPQSIMPNKLEQQRDLKKVFGVYQLYNRNKHQPEDFINGVIFYLQNNIQPPYDDILKFFFIYLNEEYHDWFFGLNSEDLSSLESFKNAFIKQSHVIRLQTSELALSKRDVFITKLKELYQTDNNLLSVINAQPLFSYFKYKWIYISRIFTSMNYSEVLEMSIFLLNEDSLKIQLLALRKQEASDFLTYVRHLDLVKK